MDAELLSLTNEWFGVVHADPFSLENCCFDKQKAFILDPAKLKALSCTRRSAKSYTGGVYLVKECLENPNSNALFLGLTRQTAMGIIWKDILKDLDKRYNLGISFNASNLTATIPNGSVIWVTGVDADQDEMNKLLGRKYRLAILDEASMYSIDQRQLVYGILKPAMADVRGTICLMGTAANETNTLFYDVVKRDDEREPGWSVHEWTAFDNPYVRVQWQEELDEIIKFRPGFMHTPLFKQWYLNEWVIDEQALVYKYNDLVNKAQQLPVDISDYEYILGVDLGHSPDATSFVVCATHMASPQLFVIETHKYQKMDFTDVALKIKELERRFKFDVKIADGANKQGLAEMNNRHGTQLIPAEKHGKVEYINLLNGDLIQGKIRLLPKAVLLADEMKRLVWVTEAGKLAFPLKEHEGMPNHCCDAFLYCWRYAYNYLWKPTEPFKDRQKQEVWEPAHIEKLTEQIRREKNPDELHIDWEEAWDDDNSLI